MAPVTAPTEIIGAKVTPEVKAQLQELAARRRGMSVRSSGLPCRRISNAKRGSGDGHDQDTTHDCHAARRATRRPWRSRRRGRSDEHVHDPMPLRPDERKVRLEGSDARLAQQAQKERMHRPPPLLAHGRRRRSYGGACGPGTTARRRARGSGRTRPQAGADRRPARPVGAAAAWGEAQGGGLSGADRPAPGGTSRSGARRETRGSCEALGQPERPVPADRCRVARRPGPRRPAGNLGSRGDRRMAARPSRASPRARLPRIRRGPPMGAVDRARRSQPALAHAVLARGAEAFHDPAGGKPLHLWANLAARNYPHMPLGYRIRPA